MELTKLNVAKKCRWKIYQENYAFLGKKIFLSFFEKLAWVPDINSHIHIGRQKKIKKMKIWKDDQNLTRKDLLNLSD